MHPLQIRDHLALHLDDLDRQDVALHQLMDLNCDMDLMHLVHLLHLDVVQNLDALVRLHLQDVVLLDAQQNLDEVRRDAVRLDVRRLMDAVVDAELRHLLRMDYFLDEEDVELPLLRRKDYFLDEAQLVHLELVELKELQALTAHLVLLSVQQLQLMPPLPPHVMPSTLQDQRRALLQVPQRALDLPLALERQPSSLQLSLPASSLQLALHRDITQVICAQPAALLLMKLIGRIRRVLVT
jgi:hypothetical protein